MTRTRHAGPSEHAMKLARELAAGCVDVLPEHELALRLDAAERDERPLRVKLGLDPTAPDIHLGHCVVLQKVRQFQDHGHTVVLIVGDYTALVGDPTGRSKTRPVLTSGEIKHNARTYQEQAFRILDEERTEVRWNGEWLARMTPQEMFALMRVATVAQILEREDFSQRMKAQQPISILELLYPLLQAYDSVAINADIEFGGTDQLFNLLMGRVVMPQYDLAPQLVMTVPILPGTDGVQRMSKSTGNYIGVTEPPAEMFGKVMSIPDAAMPEFFRLASGLSATAAAERVADLESGSADPNRAKRDLARLVIERFHAASEAAAAEEQFNSIFRRHEIPSDVATLSLGAEDHNDQGVIFLPALLVRHMGVSSNGEARRLFAQGGVKLDGTPLLPDSMEMDPADLVGRVIQVGKRRFLRILED